MEYIKLCDNTKYLITGREDIINENSFDFSKIGKINSKVIREIIDKTKTIYTTPQIIFNVQKMNEQNLQECFNYINRKFGSQY